MLASSVGTMSSNKCAVCWKEGGRACVVCKSCWYCSKKCQKDDWKSHKLLCKAIADEPDRPSPSHVRAIYFPEDKPTPVPIWINCSPNEEVPGDAGFLDIALIRGLVSKAGEYEEYLGLEKVNRDNSRNRTFPRILEYHFRDNFYNDGSPRTASFQASVRPHGEDKRDWRGSLVVLTIITEGTGELFEGLSLRYTDVTLGDFRNMIDHALGYVRRTAEDYQAVLQAAGLGSSSIVLDLGGSPPPPPPPPASEVHKKNQQGGAKGGMKAGGNTSATTNSRARGSIGGVLLECEQLRSNMRRFPVAQDHPILNGQGEISPISRMVGIPLLLRKEPEKFTLWGNQQACWMMVNLNIDDPTWGFAPLKWQLDINNVVVVREDGQDLSVIDVMNMHCFCADFLDVVQDAAEEGTRAAKEEAMAYLTPENYQQKIPGYNKGFDD
ncbi:hypothetical protein F4677DRAFT_400513 [Hypoxylon crocopeplum]|nr:hypothetical protein F4677DRAFT_400513 [Hypoxylon crocopeplum]